MGGKYSQERLARRQSCTADKYPRECLPRARQERSRADTSRPGGLERGGGCPEAFAPTLHQVEVALLRE